ncbi:MAG TPA: transposase [Urbifossiella sp.]|nr:transposase [Urbifossiella sp.]
MPIARKHRLPPECYRGRVAVAFTACLRFEPDTRLDEETVAAVRAKLAAAGAKHGCAVVVWCLMPDHLHVILAGASDDADTWRAMVSFKQQTGFWLARNRPAVAWQGDFYDHVVRSDESLDVQARYILDNPVRAGLVADWTA